METRVSAPAGSAATCWIGTVSGTFWKWRAPSAPAPPRKLGVEHTTVSRRIRALEAELDTLLFEKSRGAGFVLTEDGQRLFVHAEQMEARCTAPAKTCLASARRCRDTCASAPPKGSAAMC